MSEQFCPLLKANIRNTLFVDQSAFSDFALYVITLRTNLQNADWSMNTVEGSKITRSRLVLRLPRNSLCYRGVVFHLYFHNILLLDYSVKRPSNGTIYLGT